MGENEKNQGTLSDIQMSKRTKQILKGVLSAIEGVPDPETKQITDYAIVFYKDYKIYISADDMNLSGSQVPEAIEAADSTETTEPADVTEVKQSYKPDARRNDIRKLIGAEIDFVVKSYDDEKQTAYASRKQAMELRKILEYDKHKVNEIIPTRVLTVGRSFAIVEAYGIICRIPIEEIAWGRVYDLKDYIHVGDVARAKIIEKDNDKIKLSLRLAHKEPFQEYVIEKQFYNKFGEYKGTIRLIQDFGIFVELRRGVTVLCPYPNWIGFSPEVGKEITIRISRIKEEKRFIDGHVIRDM